MFQFYLIARSIRLRREKDNVLENSENGYDTFVFKENPCEAFKLPHKRLFKHRALDHLIIALQTFKSKLPR